MGFGSAFIAANMSTSFKVRKVYLTEHPKYNIRVKVTPLNQEAVELTQADATKSDDSEEGEDDKIQYEKETVLYKTSDYLGQKKTIHLYYDVDMNIEATAIYPDGSEEELVSYQLNMTKIMDKDVMKREKVTKPKLALQFELSRSHLFNLLSAKVAVNETVLEEVVKPDTTKKEEKSKDADEE